MDEEVDKEVDEEVDEEVNTEMKRNRESFLQPGLNLYKGQQNFWPEQP